MRRLQLLVFALSLLILPLCGYADAAPKRLVLEREGLYVSISVARDNIWLFEYSEKKIAPDDPFDFSPMLDRMVIGQDEFHAPKPNPEADDDGESSNFRRFGKHALWTNDDNAEIGLAAEEREPVFVSPYKLEGRLAGLKFKGPGFTPAHGLGADYRGGRDCQLISDAVLPGGFYGNAPIDFMGVRPTQTQLPVLAWSDGRVLVLDESRPLSWNPNSVGPAVKLNGPLAENGVLRFFLVASQESGQWRRDLTLITGRPPLPPKAAFGVWVTGLDEDADCGKKGLSQKNPEEHGAQLARLKKALPGFSGLMLKLDAPWGPACRATPPPALVAEARAQGLEVMTDFSPRTGELGPRDRRVEAFLVSPKVFLHEVSRSYDYSNPAAGELWPLLGLDEEFRRGSRHFALSYQNVREGADAWFQGRNKDDPHSVYFWHNLYSLSWGQRLLEAAEAAKLSGRPRFFLLSRAGGLGWSALGGGHLAPTPVDDAQATLKVRANLHLSGQDYYSALLDENLSERPPAEFAAHYQAALAVSAFLDLPVMVPAELAELPGLSRNLELRRKLFPYYYSSAWEAHLGGEPLFGPAAHKLDAEYGSQCPGEMMAGPSLMVGARLAPGQKEMEMGLMDREWYDFRDGRAIDDNAFPTTADGAPLLALAGSIIPVLEDVDGQGESPVLKIYLPRPSKYYEEEQSPKPIEFILYDDDGTSLDYQSGSYSARVVKAYPGQDGSLTVLFAKPQGRYKPEPKNDVRYVEIYGLEKAGAVFFDDKARAKLTDAQKLSEAANGWAPIPNGLRFKLPADAGAREHTLTIKP